MSPSTTKKALVRRYDRETLSGFVNLASFLQPEGVELLSGEGYASLVPYPEVKYVAFVRDFEGGAEPERNKFQTRPKMAGLWVNLRFRDGAVLEGIIPNNLLSIESNGFSVTPPDSAGNLQRVWAPRGSLAGVEVLGVVGSPLRKRKPAATEPKDQIGLFE